MPMQEVLAQSLGQTEPLKKETAPLSRILAWEIPQAFNSPQRTLVGYSPWGHERVEHNLVTK